MSDLKITQDDLERLTGVPILLIDREQMPFEREFFRNGTDKQKLELRVAHVMKLAEECDAIGQISIENSAFLSKTYGACCTRKTITSDPFLHVERADAFNFCGSEILSIPNESARTSCAIIMPSHTEESNLDYWRRDLKFRPEYPVVVPYEVYTLHEAGHVCFHFEGCSKSYEVCYTKETYADIWAMHTFKDLGGSPRQIEVDVYHRAIRSFLNLSPPDYWTALGCAMSMNDYPQFSFHNVVALTRELQTRAFAPDMGVDLSSFTSREVSNKFPLINEAGIALWNKSGQYFDQCFQKNPHRYFAQLARALCEAKRMSSEARYLGELTMQAYEHFCPESASKLQISPKRHHLMP